MAKKTIRVAISFAVVAILLVWLTITGFNENLQYFLEIEDVQAMGQDAYDQGLRVKGFLVAGSVELPSQTSLERFFVIEENGHQLRVRYTKETPDTFKDGAEVLVEGRLTQAGYFDAHMLMAKCPSKYETEGEYDIKNYDPSTHTVVDGTN